MGMMQRAFDWRNCMAAPTFSSISLATCLSVPSFDHFSHASWFLPPSPVSSYSKRSELSCLGAKGKGSELSSINTIFSLLPQLVIVGCPLQVAQQHQLRPVYSCLISVKLMMSLFKKGKKGEINKFITVCVSTSFPHE
jgi:hypothetical protein